MKKFFSPFNRSTLMVCLLSVCSVCTLEAMWHRDRVASNQPLDSLFPIKKEHHKKLEKVPESISRVSVPSKFSWLDQGMMTPVKDQGKAGGCLAFATLGSYEASIKIKYGEEIDLSEQFLLSDFPSFYSIKKFNGAIHESVLPYSGIHEPFASNSIDTLHRLVYPVENIHTIGNSVNEIKEAIMQYGPVSSFMTFDNYYLIHLQSNEDKIFEDATFKKRRHLVGIHANTICGWDDEKGSWLIKETLGLRSGVCGYVWIKYGANEIGDGSTVAVPTCTKNYEDYPNTLPTIHNFVYNDEEVKFRVGDEYDKNKWLSRSIWNIEIKIKPSDEREYSAGYALRPGGGEYKFFDVPLKWKENIIFYTGNDPFHLNIDYQIILEITYLDGTKKRVDGPTFKHPKAYEDNIRFYPGLHNDSYISETSLTEDFLIYLSKEHNRFRQYESVKCVSDVYEVESGQKVYHTEQSYSGQDVVNHKIVTTGLKEDTKYSVETRYAFGYNGGYDYYTDYVIHVTTTCKAPFAPRATNITARTSTINWTNKSSRRYVKYPVMVKYRIEGGCWRWFTQTDANGKADRDIWDDTFCNLKDLTPDKTYEVELFTANMPFETDIDLPPSSRFTFKTLKEEGQCAAPQKLRSESETFESATIRWQPGCGNVPVSSYDVEYQEVVQINPESTVKIHATNTQQTFAHLTGLKENTLYNVFVIANCINGERQTNNITLLTKGKDEKHSSEMFVTAVIAGIGIVVISWAAYAYLSYYFGLQAVAPYSPYIVRIPLIGNPANDPVFLPAVANGTYLWLSWFWQSWSIEPQRTPPLYFNALTEINSNTTINNEPKLAPALNQNIVSDQFASKVQPPFRISSLPQPMNHKVILSGLGYGTTYRLTMYYKEKDSVEKDTTVTFTTAACTSPPSVSVSAISRTSATLSWKPTASTYSIKIKPANKNEYWVAKNIESSFNQSTGLVSYTLTGLLDGNYTATVYGDCANPNPTPPMFVAPENTIGTSVSFSTRCVAPDSLKATGIKSTSATIAWMPNAAQSYTLQLIERGAVIPILSKDIPATTSSYTLTKLRGNTSYTAKVYANCSDGSKSFSTTAFTTTCLPPDSVYVSNISSKSATIHWTDSGADGYAIQVQNRKGAKYWAVKNVTGTSTSFNLSGLSTDNIYTVSVYANYPDCSKAKSCEFVVGCVAPAALKVTNVGITKATIQWTDVLAPSYSVRVNGGWVAERIKANSYNITNLKANKNYMVEVYANCQNGSTEASNISFSTLPPCSAPANVWSSDISISTATIHWSPTSAESCAIELNGTIVKDNIVGTSHTLTGLTAGTNYAVTLYANCPESRPSIGCSFTTALCAAPASVSVGELTHNTATITWAEAGATTYSIKYKPNDESQWKTATSITSTSHTLTDLLANTTYTAEVYANCTAGALSKSCTFTSFGCASPAPLTISDLTPTAVTVNWTDTGATNYDVEIKPTNELWRIFVAGVTGSSYNTGSLLENRNYVASVYAHCTAGGRSAVANYAFATPAQTNGSGVSANKLLAGQQNNELTFVAYPNPFSRYVTLSYTLPYAQAVSIVVYNLSGMVVKQVLAHQLSSKGTNTITWNGKNDKGESIAPGIYICQLKTSEKISTIRLSVIK